MKEITQIINLKEKVFFNFNLGTYYWGSGASYIGEFT